MSRPVPPSPAAFFDDKNRAFWVLQGAGWTGYLLLRIASGIANGLGIAFLIQVLVSAATGYSMTLVMAAVYRWFIRKSPLVIWAGTLGTVIVAVGAYSTIDAWVYTMVKEGRNVIEVDLFLGSAVLNALLLGAWSALYYSINFFILLEEQSDRLLRLESQASNAQLAMLRYQLNPHFLFNTLNSISTLVLLKQTERANAMLSRLSSFLRYTLVNESAGTVSLAQEVETLKLYLEIEKMRFEDRLRPHFHIDPGAMDAQLPSLLLQPMIENGIKYAVAPQEEGADISVEARRHADRVIITVSDTGPGADALYNVRAQQSTGVGLANIRDRLAQAYGDNHRFETQSDITGGFRVFIDIPYQIETEDPK